MQVKKQQLELDMEQSTGSKLGWSTSRLYVVSLLIWFIYRAAVVDVQWPRHTRLFVIPWTAECHIFLSFTFSQSLFKLMSIESVMPSNHLVLCRPLLLLPSTFPNNRVFPTGQLFASGGQSIGVSASASVLPMNIQTWSLLGWTGWISLQSKGLSKVFSSTTVQKHQFFGTQSSLWSNSHIPTWLMEKLEG